MARDLNKCMFTGRLGRDPEMRYTATGTAITTFRIASNRQWRDASGRQQEDVEWVSVVAFERLAEVANQYLQKGDKVYVEGRLQTRSWQDRDGQERRSVEVVLQELIMLSSRGERPAPDLAEADDEAIADAPTPSPPPTPTPAPRPLATPRGAVPRRPAADPIDDAGDVPF